MIHQNSFRQDSKPPAHVAKRTVRPARECNLHHQAGGGVKRSQGWDGFSASRAELLPNCELTAARREGGVPPRPSVECEVEFA